MKKVKVAHFTSVHPPFDIRILHKECKTLARAGYDVVLVAPHDRNEMCDGVQIRAVAKTSNLMDSTSAVIGGLFKRLQRVTHLARKVYRAALAENAQIYHFHDPELIPVSVLLKLRGKRVIYDVHEDLPRQILSKYWIPRLLRHPVARAAEFVENMAACFFNGVVAATPIISRRFPGTKTVTVHNFPILGEAKSLASVPYVDRAPLIAYTGGLNVRQGIREIVTAMDLLPESLGANLNLAGEWESYEVESEVQQLPGWKSVTFLGWQERDEVMRLLHSAKVGIVVDHPIVNYLESYSTKLFEYMAAGIPVIASNFPLWRAMIAEADCGLLVDPLDPEAIAGAIQWLLTHPKEAEAMGNRGQEAVHARYNWDAEAGKLLSLYRRVLQ